jgi:hypothetical protein
MSLPFSSPYAEGLAGDRSRSMRRRTDDTDEQATRKEKRPECAGPTSSRRDLLRTSLLAGAAATLPRLVSTASASSSTVKPFELDEISIAELQRAMSTGELTARAITRKFLFLPDAAAVRLDVCRKGRRVGRSGADRDGRGRPADGVGLRAVDAARGCAEAAEVGRLLTSDAGWAHRGASDASAGGTPLPGPDDGGARIRYGSVLAADLAGRGTRGGDGVAGGGKGAPGSRLGGGPDG